MYVCNEVSTRQSLASVACSGQLPRHGSFTNPMLQFLTSRPVLRVTRFGRALPLHHEPWGAHAGHGGVGLWSLKSSRSNRLALTGAILLLLGAGTLNCTTSPQQQDDPTPPLGVTSAKNANQREPRASADAESARKDLPKASCPQDILKVRPPNSLDYRAHYDTPAATICT